MFDGGEASDGLAFEWLIESRDGDTCIVRLVSTGFRVGAEWDNEYHGMKEGWQLFLLNLRLHLQHFRGRTATAMLPSSTWPTPTEESWAYLYGPTPPHWSNETGAAGKPGWTATTQPRQRNGHQRWCRLYRVSSTPSGRLQGDSPNGAHRYRAGFGGVDAERPGRVTMSLMQAAASTEWAGR